MLDCAISLFESSLNDILSHSNIFNSTAKHNVCDSSMLNQDFHESSLPCNMIQIDSNLNRQIRDALMESLQLKTRYLDIIIMADEINIKVFCNSWMIDQEISFLSIAIY